MHANGIVEAVVTKIQISQRVEMMKKSALVFNLLAAPVKEGRVFTSELRLIL